MILSRRPQKAIRRVARGFGPKSKGTEVSGVDLSEKMLTRARRRAGRLHQPVTLLRTLLEGHVIHQALRLDEEPDSRSGPG